MLFLEKLENVRNHEDIKLVTTEALYKKLSREKYFLKNLLAIEMKKKTQLIMNKSVYWGLSILEISKTVV